MPPEVVGRVSGAAANASASSTWANARSIRARCAPVPRPPVPVAASQARSRWLATAACSFAACATRAASAPASVSSIGVLRVQHRDADEHLLPPGLAGGAQGPVRPAQRWEGAARRRRSAGPGVPAAVPCPSARSSRSFPQVRVALTCEAAGRQGAGLTRLSSSLIERRRSREKKTPPVPPPALEPSVTPCSRTWTLPMVASAVRSGSGVKSAQECKGARAILGQARRRRSPRTQFLSRRLRAVTKALSAAITPALSWAARGRLRAVAGRGWGNCPSALRTVRRAWTWPGRWPASPTAPPGERRSTGAKASRVRRLAGRRPPRVHPRAPRRGAAAGDRATDLRPVDRHGRPIDDSTPEALRKWTANKGSRVSAMVRELRARTCHGGRAALAS